MARKPNTFSEETDMQTDVSQPIIAEQATSPDHNRSRCGGALQAEREVQALSIQDIASKLRLSPKQIEAIEADHFAKLPEPTIVRGFIRNYAKLLKINAEPLLDAYTVIVPTNAQYQLTVKPSSNMHVSSGDKPKTSSYILTGLLAMLALGAWLFYQNYIEKPSPTKLSANVDSANVDSANVDILELLPQPALPAAERAPQEPTTLQPSTELVLPPAADASALPAPVAEPLPADSAATAPITSDLATVSALPVVAAPIVAGQLPVAAAAPGTSPAATPVATSAGMARLEFSATQETWIRVTDAKDKTIYDKIIFAGSRESIEAKQPLNLVVGNAGATSLNVNGKAIELAPHSRNNVARIKLE